ncbi:MAG: Gfo/Idh/MocA family oxidoreductase [Chloroflexi bacterium]|nr:Gfo/Idh/MocA family oxidoreductase [Chloroflexota bacterium]
MTRVAVIGVGSMGKNHARVYSELPEAELVAVADENEANATSVGNTFGARGYTDYRALLEKEKPEAVSIAVPTALHETVALAALEAGAHILVEKPIAATLEEGQHIIEAARRYQRCLMVGHIVRFNPAIQLLKIKLQSGELGRIFQIFCRRAGPFPARIRDVGVVIDLAPHDVDIMRFLVEQDPDRVYAETAQRIHTEHEDLLFGMLHFPSGITGALEINWLTPTKVREVLVLGERGLFRVDDLVQDLYFYENAQASGELWPTLRTIKGVSEGTLTRFTMQRYEPLKAELQAFLKAVRGQAAVPVTGEDGLAALRLALALVESGRTHQIVGI